MKEITILYTFLILFTTFFKANSQDNNIDNNINFIYDYCHNVTIMEVDLENVEEDYIYYYYPFNSLCFQYKKELAIIS